MTIAVVSSCYGGYDKPRPAPEQDVDCEWVLVTDNPVEVPGWRVVVEPRPHAHPRLAAKVAKFRPDLYSNADVLVWLDGHVVVHNRSFISKLNEWLGSHSIAMFRHPSRQSIADEASASAWMPKYEGQSIHSQVGHYGLEGHNPNWGLWATGVSVRQNNEVCQRFGDAWFLENARWTYQDQISLPFVLRQFHVDIGDLPRIEWGVSFGFTAHKDGSC